MAQSGIANACLNLHGSRPHHDRPVLQAAKLAALRCAPLAQHTGSKTQSMAVQLSQLQLPARRPNRRDSHFLGLLQPPCEAGYTQDDPHNPTIKCLQELLAQRYAAHSQQRDVALTASPGTSAMSPSLLLPLLPAWMNSPGLMRLNAE
eukprot:GHRQ01035253.1.p2 GENE.GHRQ01035253.1~~GHRQ01035253.1.p2  ORF type:complete len:148 (+),score=28.65 GHRQ01035253.1:64-507(+)